MDFDSRNPENRRQLGQRLAAFVCSPSFSTRSSTALVGVVADLVAGDPDMGSPLRDLVTRPVFLDLLPFARQGGAKALLQRDSLLNELNRTYKADIVAAVEDVLNGFLDLQIEADPSQENSDDKPAAIPQPPSDFAPEDRSQHNEKILDVQESSFGQSASIANSGWVGVLIFLGLMLGIAGVAGLFQAPSSTSTPKQVNWKEEEPSQLSKATSRKLDSLQQDLDQAVLMCEIKPLIDRIQDVETTGMANASNQKKTMLANANQRIAFLDADGDDAYAEYDDCSYGIQYFDNERDPNSENNVRVFAAVSRKCRNPKLKVQFSLDDNSDYISELEYIRPIPKHLTGPLLFPDPDFTGDFADSSTYWYNASILCG